jgi:hypothetical protein
LRSFARFQLATRMLTRLGLSCLLSSAFTFAHLSHNDGPIRSARTLALAIKLNYEQGLGPADYQRECSPPLATPTIWRPQQAAEFGNNQKTHRGSAACPMRRNPASDTTRQFTNFD